MVELHRRGIERAGRVGAVVDGKEWCQSFIDYHYPEALRILDLPHAAEHLTTIGQTRGADGALLSATRLKQGRERLRDEGPAGILAELRPLVAAQPSTPELAAALAYLEKRQVQMNYPEFQAQGWPIVGSGVVESANKLMVEARLKGAGMHWQERNVNPILALRNALCNERWEESWSLSEQELRQQVLQRRKQRKQVMATPPPARSEPPLTMSPAASAIGLPAPAEPKSKSGHPWRRAWSIRRQRELANAA